MNPVSFSKLEVPALRRLSDGIISSGRINRSVMLYEKCRQDIEFHEYHYRSLLASFIAFAIAAPATLVALIVTSFTGSYVTALAAAVTAGSAAAAVVYYMKLFSVRSLKEYRGAMIDASIVHAVGFMFTMADSNVPLKKMFENLSNLEDVYGEDIALESSYVISLVEEDGMDIVSALSKAQSSSPSPLWQDLLIGISGVHSSGGSLIEYLKIKYEYLGERKRSDIKKYNEKLQGLSSIYLSAIGISAIFIALVNLVFNMASFFSGDSLVWLDALVIVPIGSFIIIRTIQAASPEAL